MKILLLIDSFGRTPHFLIKKRLRLSSIFGGIMTIILYLIAVIVGIFFGQDLIYRNNPSVNLSSKHDEHPKVIPYFNNYEFMIGIMDSEGKIEINERIYYAKAFLTTITPGNTSEVKIYETIEINLERCNETYKNSNKTSFFKNIDLENHYCISKNQSIPLESIEINEYVSNVNFKSIDIQVYDCFDENEGTCESQSEIDFFLAFASLHWVMLDNLVDTRNHEAPFQIGIKENNFLVTNKYTLQIAQYIKHLNIFSDDGYIFTTQNQQNTFQQDKTTDATVYYRIGPFFTSVTIQLSNNIEEYYRRYYKLQDLAAQVGGIYETIFFALGLINWFYTEHNLFEYLINRFFEIKIKEDKKLKIRQNHFNLKKEIDTSPKDIYHKTSPKSIQLTTLNNTYRTAIPSPLKVKMKNNNRIVLNFFDKLVFLTFYPQAYCAKKHRVNILYKQGRDEIANYLEIDKVLQRFHSTDMLENLLMNEQQKKIFDFIFKPVLTHNFFGTRYNSKNLPMKTKEKILGTGSVVIPYSSKDIALFDIQTKNNSWSK